MNIVVCLGSLSLACSYASGSILSGQIATLVSFNGTNGATPSGALVQDSNGSLYGTTASGGVPRLGTIFRLDPDGTFRTIYAFRGEGDGKSPAASLVKGPDGDFYGTAQEVGPYTDAFGAHIGYGSIFKISAAGIFTPLIAFQGTNGSYPWTSTQLTVDTNGGFMGTTLRGGTNYTAGGPSDGFGTVFRMDANGLLSTLCNFDGVTNNTPYAGLTQGADGAFYGTTGLGGGGGNIFRITDGGQLSNIANFEVSNGYAPHSSLLLANDGNLYGTTVHGGASAGNTGSANPYGFGTIFRLSASGELQTLFSFYGTNGANPAASLIQAGDGKLYGVASQGGGEVTGSPGVASGNGTVFCIDTNGAFQVLCRFNSTNGATPVSALVQAADGSFYGTTAAGGAYGLGTIFRMTVHLAPVVQAVTQGGNGVRLSWTGVVGQTYQVQYSGDLSGSSWSNLGTAAVATNSFVTVTDTPGSQAARFYRVLLLP